MIDVSIFQIGQVMALIAKTISSFCLLHLVEVSVLRILSVCFALVIVTFMCCEKVCFGVYSVSKSILAMSDKRDMDQ